MTVVATVVRELVAAIRATGKRSLVGLTGPPGSGKSTLAAELAESLSSPPVVPMDGFHLPQAAIEAKRLVDRKGSPETFDSWGFVDLLTQIARVRNSDEKNAQLIKSGRSRADFIVRPG